MAMSRSLGGTSLTTRSPMLIVPLRDHLEPGDHAQRGGLAAARRADEDHELLVGDVEVELADGLGAVGVDLPHVVEDDLSHGSTSPCASRRRAVVRRRRRRSTSSSGEPMRRRIHRRRSARSARASRSSASAEVAAVEQRLADGREPDVGRELDVVEPDDRQVLGTRQADVGGRGEDAGGLHVGGGEDRGRRVRQREQLRGSRWATVRSCGPWRTRSGRHAIPASSSTAAVAASRAACSTVKPNGLSGSSPMKPIARARARAGAAVAMRPPSKSSVTPMGTPSPRASTSTTGTPALGQPVEVAGGQRQGHDQQAVGAVAAGSSAPRCSSRWTGDSTLNSTRS